MGLNLILSHPTVSLLVLNTTKHGEGKKVSSPGVQGGSSEKACPGVEIWFSSVCVAVTREGYLHASVSGAEF